MDRTLRLAIADDEPRIARMLADLVETEKWHIEVCGTATDGEMLLSLIRRERPDIVISDIYMPKLDGLEVLRRVKQEGIDCRYIMVTGYKQFDYAYTALKYAVDDFILKPVDAGALNDSLGRIAEELRRKDTPENGTEGLRRLLLAGDPERFGREDTLARLNSMYGTQFEEGRFRFLIIKEDYDVSLAETPDELASLQEKLERVTERLLGSFCYDIVFDRRLNSIHALLNYRPGDEAELMRAMETTLREINMTAGLFPGMYTTMGVSTPVSSPEAFGRIAAGAARAILERRIGGTGRLYLQTEEKPIPDTYRYKLRTLEERILRTYDSLDAEEYCRAVDELFLLPGTILIGDEAVSLMRSLVTGVFEKNGELIRKCCEKDSLLEDILWDAENAYTLEKYHAVLRDRVGGILRDLKDYSANQNSRIVRQATAYIEANYARDIGVEETAAHVNLSTGYFSSVFKKETGKTFTEYVTAVRMERAKELLRNSAYNINEIADAVGMPNARYFSKQFKRSVGLTPKEFRQIHG